MTNDSTQTPDTDEQPADHPSTQTRDRTQSDDGHGHGFAEPAEETTPRQADKLDRESDPNRGQYPDGAHADQQTRSTSDVSEDTQQVMDEMVERGEATRVVEDADGEIRSADAEDQPGDVRQATEEERQHLATGDAVFNDDAPANQSASSGREQKADELREEVERRRQQSTEQDKAQAFGDDEPDVDPVSTDDLGLTEDGGPDFSKLKEDRSYSEEMNGLVVTFHEPESEDALVNAIQQHTSDEEDMMGMRKGAALAIAKVEGYAIPEAEWDEFSTSNKMRIGNKALNLSGVMDFTVGRRGGRGQTRGSR